MTAEAIITNAGVPWTILRATQFYDLLDMAMRFAAKFPVAFLPTDFLLQPVDSGEVAEALCQAVASAPAGRLPDMGGPAVRRAGDLARAWLKARGLRRLIIPLRLPGKIGHGFRSGYNTCPQHRQGKVTWTEWLAQTSQVSANPQVVGART